MKIGIVGYGHVGQAMGCIFKNHTIYDKNLRGYSTDKDKKITNKRDIAIICVPTPQGRDGTCDISAVEECVQWIETPLILIKSTVPPGTTDTLAGKYNKRICFSPEYYGESKYWLPEEWNDPLAWPFLIIGGAKEDTKEIIKAFIPMLGPTKRYIHTDAKTAELVKYMENCWFAMMVTFQNEFYEIAQRFGIDYNELRELFLADPRIKGFHPIVFPYKRGYDGKCLPKDVMAIIKACQNMDYFPRLLYEIHTSNEVFKNKQE